MLRDSLRRAIEYAVGAAQLLRRHPSLLLVALAMAAFATADGQMGPAIEGRKADLTLALYRRTGGTEWDAPRRATSEAAALAQPRIPSISIAGTADVAYRLARRLEMQLHPHERPRMFTRALLLRLLLTIFSAAIGVFCTGGYAGVVWHTLDIGQPDWSRFLANGRRLFWRLSGSLVLAWPIWGVAYAIAWLRVWRTGSIGWSGLLPIAVGLVPITFFLGLTRFVIVADDARLVTAVRRSVSTVWHDLPIALVLVVGANAVHWAVVTLPVHHILQIMGGGEAARAAYGLRAIPIYLVSSCCSYVLAAWFCATTFLWYRDARTDTGASRPADSAPAET